jgi:hypothetical protein
MIIVKNSQLNTETVSSLNKLVEMDINAKLAFRLMRIIKEISSLVEDKLKLEKKIFERWVEKDADGNPVQATDESGNVIPGAVKIKDMEAFNQEMYDLMTIENEVGYEQVDFDDLNLETAKIKDLMKIEFLFK